MVESDDDIDFALAAYREHGAWVVGDLARDHLDDIESLAQALRRLPGEEGAVALVGVDEDFFLIVRTAGARVRVLLSDVTAAEEWELAASAVDFLGLSDLADLGDAEPVPAGDLDLLGDLGVGEIDLSSLLDDGDLYPDEILSDVARHLGFGSEFDDAVGLTPATS